MRSVTCMARIHWAFLLAVVWLCPQLVMINSQAGFVGFYLNGMSYTNSSTVLRTDIGVEDAALQCTTDSTTCCSNTFPEVRGGEFYFPDEGGLVPVRIASFSQGYYRNRDSQLIRLNRWPNGTTTGEFRCEIPDSSGRNLSLFINIVDITVSITPNGNSTAGEAFDLECSAIVNGSNDQLNITWLNPDGGEILFGTINTTNNSSTLTFSRLFTSDTGTYTCRVVLGSVEKRENFTLTVEAGVSLTLRGTLLPNNSYVNEEKIGAGGPDGRNDVEGLLCHTNKEDCCALGQVEDGTVGEWIFPNGSIVESKSSNTGFGRTDYFFRNRFKSVVRLLRVGQPNERGLFRCELPNANNINQTLYVNIVNITPTHTSTIYLQTPTAGSLSNSKPSIYITASITLPSPTPSILIRISIVSSGSNIPGDTFALICSVISSESTEQPIITWLNSTSQALTTRLGDDRVRVSGTTMDPSGSFSNSLSFNPLVVTDAGLYMCQATLQGVTRVEITTLTINNTAVQISDGGVTPLLGQHYNLTCNMAGSNSFNFTYIWKKDGTTLNESGPILTFTQLRLSDAGQYVCELVGSVSIISNPLSLILPVPTPELVVTTHSIIPYSGTVFNLTGTLQIDTSIVNIDVTVLWEWSFNGTILMYQETVSPPHQSILTFHPLASNSTGEYTLRVTLMPFDSFLFVNENSVSVVYNLSVLPLPPRPPNISVISRQSFPDDFCGEVMTLSCTPNPVGGLFLPPQVMWIDSEGSEIPTGGNNNPRVESQTRHLIFSDVTTDNVGLYKCRTVITIPEALIDNHFDESSTTITTSLPEQVKNLSCVTSLSSRQLSIIWRQPTFQGNEIVDYRVQVKQVKHRNGTREVIESGIQDNTTKSEEYICNGLDPQVPYNITVIARNPSGCGKEKQIYCFTQEGEPPPPMNVTVVRFNSTAIGVSWFKYTLVELNGVAQYIITYDIIISSRKRVIGGSITVPWTNNRIIISNLQAGAQYRILVQTSTSAGMSVPIEVRTDKEQGNNPTASPSNSSTIIAIVSGIVAVIVVLAVAAIIIAALKFALKLHRRKVFRLQTRSFDSPLMMTNAFYEPGGDGLTRPRIDAVDHGYETVDKYNAGYIDPKAPQPYEEIPLSRSLQQSKLHSSGSYAQCPLYASATTESDEKQTAETCFSQGLSGPDNVRLVTQEEEARYIISELQDGVTESAYATVR